MKTKNIIVLVILAVAIGVIVSLTIDNSSSYVGFADAEQMAKNGNSKAIHVVGELKKDANNQAVGMLYEPSVNPNRFEFMMTDSLGYESKVVYGQPKPADLDKSEKVVVVGKMNLEQKCFEADQILLKCPSKYNNGELKTETAER